MANVASRAVTVKTEVPEMPEIHNISISPGLSDGESSPGDHVYPETRTSTPKQTRPRGVIRPWETSPSDQQSHQAQSLGTAPEIKLTPVASDNLVTTSPPLPHHHFHQHHQLFAQHHASFNPPGNGLPTTHPLHRMYALLHEPNHSQWAHGVLSWYFYEVNRCQTHLTLTLTAASSSRETAAIVTSHQLLQLKLVSHLSSLLDARLLVQHIPRSTPSPNNADNSEDERPHQASNDSAYHSIMDTPSPIVAKDSVHCNSGYRGSRNLPTHAVQLMEEWYQANFDHPYPDRRVVQHFATIGNISPNQVKKWMANKRVRSLNTLSYNGSVHPKRLQRLMRETAARKLALSPYSRPTYPTDNSQVSQQVSPQFHAN